MRQSRFLKLYNGPGKSEILLMGRFYIFESPVNEACRYRHAAADL